MLQQVILLVIPPIMVVDAENMQNANIAFRDV